MHEVELPVAAQGSPRATFAACVATVLECPLRDVPTGGSDSDPASNGALRRWLAGMGLGLVPIADAASFSWAGPWIARVQSSQQDARRAVVMYGVPSGVVWDPGGITGQAAWSVVDGFVLAAADIARARPVQPDPVATTGTIQALHVAASAGEPARELRTATALAGRGLDGDRHVEGRGTFPSDVPGSALTLIEAEVCESFSPPLGADEHRRNIVTRDLDLNALVGHEFTIGAVRCRGMRLCEPCAVIDGYAGRPVLRPLVHRGGLRADVLEDGSITVGDTIHTRPG